MAVCLKPYFSNMRVSRGDYCSAMYCSHNKGRNPDLTFFSFPVKDIKRRQKWINNTQREGLTLENVKFMRLCSDHFEMDQFMNEKKRSLIWNAVPTLFAHAPVTLKRKASDPPPAEGPIPEVPTAIVPEHPAPRLPRRTTISSCFVPGCESGCNGDVTHTFRPHPNVVKEWQQVLATVQPDQVYHPKKHSVCYKHFNPAHILKEDTTGADGEVLPTPRIKWQLASDAVPIFPTNLPKYRSRKKKFKPLEECVDLFAPPLLTPRSAPSSKPNSESGQSQDVGQDKENDDQDEVSVGAFGQCGSSLEQLFRSWPACLHPDWCSKMKNGSWFLFQVDFSKLALQIVKYVEIRRNHTFRVFIGNLECETKMEQSEAGEEPETAEKKLTSYDDILLVLKEVEALRACDGVRGFDRLVTCPTGIFTKTCWHSVNCRMTSDAAVCDKCQQLVPLLKRRLKKMFRISQLPVPEMEQQQPVLLPHQVKQELLEQPQSEADQQQHIRQESQELQQGEADQQQQQQQQEAPTQFLFRSESDIKLDNVRQLLMESRKKCRSFRTRLSRVVGQRDVLIRTLREVNRAAQPEVQLDRLLESVNVSDGVKMIVKAAHATAKAKSAKAIRHSSEWLTLSYELMQKSARAYAFLAKRKILPLPSDRTIQRWKPTAITILPPEPEPNLTMTYDFFDEVLAPQPDEEEEEEEEVPQYDPPEDQQHIFSDHDMVEVQVVTLQEGDAELYQANLIELALAYMQ